MIKASVLNYVRQRADEAKQWGELHETLTKLSGQESEIKRTTAQVEQLTKDRVAAEGKLKAVQEQITQAQQQHAVVQIQAQAAMKAANDHVADAESRAKLTIGTANAHAKDIFANADAVLHVKNDEIARKGEDLRKVEGDLDAKKKEYDELVAKHGELQRRHDALARGLDALKPSL